MGTESIRDEYIRVGTAYYKITWRPTLRDHKVRQLLPWNLSTIVRDHGKDFISAIPRYDGFTIFPGHVNYHRVIGDRFYNLYEPLPFKPAPGKFDHIEQMLRHIFEEQYELILDYIQLAYLNPLQDLPIILLVSKERATGKSTFLNLMYAIFGLNATFNTNNDLMSQFNSDWSGKLFILVDEVLLRKREFTERLKNLSTAQTFKMEAKGKDRQEEDFFGKFILCSNNVDCPLIIDPEETRFWVRKVKPLQTDDTGMLHKAILEIPALLYFLSCRNLSTTNSSRMFFDPKLLNTPALQHIKQTCRNPVESAMYEICQDVMPYTENGEYAFLSGDLLDILLKQGVRTDDMSVRRILKFNWHLKPRQTPSTYVKYIYSPFAEIPYARMSGKGRYYTVTADFLQSVYDSVDL